jgi:hypothetical protein
MKILLFFVGLSLIISCKKEYSCENCMHPCENTDRSGPLQIISPRLNEVVRQGQTYQTLWTGGVAGNDEYTVMLNFIQNGRSHFEQLGKVKVTECFFKWTAQSFFPDTVINSYDCRLIFTGQSTYIESNTFAIIP